MPHLEHGMVVDGHLGGYVPGGDPSTFYPDIWEWAINTLGVRSVLDVGCGDGVALRWFRDHGCDVWGFDGIPQDDPDIHEIDYTKSRQTFGRNLRFDLCWCCEFVEHIEEQYIPNFLSTFEAADLLMMTHAEPGQPGWHHVNCQTDQYWIDKVEGAGFEFDWALTDTARELAKKNEQPGFYFLRTGLVFRNVGRA